MESKDILSKLLELEELRSRQLALAIDVAVQEARLADTERAIDFATHLVMHHGQPAAVSLDAGRERHGRNRALQEAKHQLQNLEEQINRLLYEINRSISEV